MPENATDEKLTLVQVMACCHQQAITWTNVDPDICHHMASLCHNELNSETAPKVYLFLCWMSIKKTAICPVLHVQNIRTIKPLSYYSWRYLSQNYYLYLQYLFNRKPLETKHKRHIFIIHNVSYLPWQLICDETVDSIMIGDVFWVTVPLLGKSTSLKRPGLRSLGVSCVLRTCKQLNKHLCRWWF